MLSPWWSSVKRYQKFSCNVRKSFSEIRVAKPQFAKGLLWKPKTGLVTLILRVCEGRNLEVLCVFGVFGANPHTWCSSLWIYCVYLMISIWILYDSIMMQYGLIWAVFCLCICFPELWDALTLSNFSRGLAPWICQILHGLSVGLSRILGA